MVVAKLASEAFNAARVSTLADVQGVQKGPSSDSDYLDSWKEIAAYLRRTVRTAQRWEEHESLPVHRHIHKESATVYAFKSELSAWRLKRGDAHGSTAYAFAMTTVGN
jgi:hypothetical protein